MRPPPPPEPLGGGEGEVISRGCGCRWPPAAANEAGILEAAVAAAARAITLAAAKTAAAAAGLCSAGAVGTEKIKGLLFCNAVIVRNFPYLVRVCRIN